MLKTALSYLFITLLLIATLFGCGARGTEATPAPETPEPVAVADVTPSPVPAIPSSIPPLLTIMTLRPVSLTADTGEVLASLEARTICEAASLSDEMTAVTVSGLTGYVPTADLHVVSERDNGFVVVIDPGHQSKANLTPEPVGPGASETKASVTLGTRGQQSGLWEYELNLTLALALRDTLQAKGYIVLLTRESHDVDISNASRAAIANEAKADVFLRIHANGSEDANRQGAMTICQTRNNPYQAELYEESRALCDCVLDSLVEATGCHRETVWETDTMSGINYSQVPVCIVEVGYMSNPAEDQLLATADYQEKIVKGLAEGIDAYLLQAG